MRRLAFTGALAMACILVPAASALASFPGQNGKIAFYGYVANVPGIYTVNLDGSDATRVVGDGGGFPAWSADGHRLAYSDRRLHGLYLAGADGTGQTEIKAAAFTSGPTSSREDVFSEPAWSPDGGTIAYETDNWACGQHAGCTQTPLGLRAIGSDGAGDRLLMHYPAGDPAY